jgi:hypothetical protein
MLSLSSLGTLCVSAFIMAKGVDQAAIKDRATNR